MRRYGALCGLLIVAFAVQVAADAAAPLWIACALAACGGLLMAEMSEGEE